VTRRLPGLRGAALAVALALGCQSIAGIEDRVYEGEPAVSPACRKYCDTVMTNCTGASQVYTTDETCLGVCALLDPGDTLEPVGNTVACRTHQATLAAMTGEPQPHCRRAGPGGDGHCGNDCESYCRLFAAACGPEVPNQAECVEKCAALENQDRFDVVADHEGDTVECRLVHVSSATVQPEPHCGHSRFVASQWCLEPPSSPPDCADYCRIVMAACTGDLAQYESSGQCTDVCSALEPGRNDQRVENTVGCRKYHAYSSLLDPATHCSHAGPGGDGHCGPATQPPSGSTGNCESYCTLLAAACPEDFDAAFADRADCIAACTGLDGAGPDSKYSVGAEPGATLQCRLLEVARAFAEPAACAGALGGSPCQ
jgi:hypothetical protein